MQLNLLPDTYNNGEVEEGKHCENLLAVVGVGAVVCCGSKGSVDRTGQTNPATKIRRRISVHFLSMEDKRGQTRACPHPLVASTCQPLELLWHYLREEGMDRHVSYHAFAVCKDV